MISVICTLYNRAHLLKWSLKAIQDNFSLPDLHDVEINVLDDHSTDDLDTVLQAFSSVFGVVNKWEWDSKKSLSPRRFNCPAEPYNILVKLAAGEYIYKTDPEMVILDTQFVSKAMAILKDNPSAIVMPFPYHCYEFPFDSIDIIKRDYLKYHYPTHITKDNAKREMVYYQSLFKKEKYFQIGGIEEKFGN
jgi:glycosyltransferase involved in cell wall biosynthesis